MTFIFAAPARKKRNNKQKSSLPTSDRICHHSILKPFLMSSKGFFKEFLQCQINNYVAQPFTHTNAFLHSFVPKTCAWNNLPRLNYSC